MLVQAYTPDSGNLQETTEAGIGDGFNFRQGKAARQRCSSITGLLTDGAC